MIGTLYIDDLDGAVTLFKSTDEGTETIAVFDEEYREVLQDLLTEIKRLQERLDWILGDEELASYVWEKEVAYMEWEGVRLPWISADEWGEEE